MICIYCFHKKTSIINSRARAKDSSTWRRHACPNCGKKFSSVERPVMADSYVLTDESRAEESPYSRSRLAASVARAFGHLSGDGLFTSVDWLCDTAERSLIRSAYYGRISKDEFGMLVYEILKNYDPVAGVQYAAQNGLVSAVGKRRGRPSVR